jgi:hypothetical protein
MHPVALITITLSFAVMHNFSLLHHKSHSSDEIKVYTFNKFMLCLMVKESVIPWSREQQYDVE